MTPMTSCGPLTEAAMASMRAYFAACNHNPSARHWEALQDVLRVMEDMVNGQCPTKVFLSAIDPGIGKSQATVHMARQLVASRGRADVGMIICVGRITEAESLANELRDCKRAVAVLTSDLRLNDRCSGGTVADAQVLITTQQRLERATNGRAFGEVAALHYRGEPRRVRVWDEAFIPGVAVTLAEDDIGFLFKPARRLSEAFHAALRGLFLRLPDAKTGDVVDVPDWERSYGVCLPDLLAAIPGGDQRLRDDQNAAATSLFILGGKSASVWRDNREGSAVLSYRNTLPDDLAPLVVLDASGRVRHVYADMAKHRGLGMLKDGPKDYAPLKVHVWNRSGSKAGFEKRGDELARGIASTIKERPTEKWLVVIHKADRKVGDVEKAIRRHLPKSAQGNVTMITWGNHMATNDYADVPNLILAGTLFMRRSHYAAMTHLAQDRPTGPGLATPDEIARTTLGEHANLILQAICRGRVRKANGDQCLPMEAYIIASAWSHIREALPTIFPGADIRTWRPAGRVKGKVGQAIAFVETRINEGEAEVLYRDIQEAVSIPSNNFAKTVTRNPEWADMIDRLGLRPLGGAKRTRGLTIKNNPEPVAVAA